MERYTVRFEPAGMCYQAKAGMTLLEAMIEAGLTPDAPCGGKGNCGKCRVRILQGPCLGEALACQTRIESDLVVDPLIGDKKEQILTHGAMRAVPLAPYGTDAHLPGTAHVAIAFDIGTTTIVGYLLQNGEQTGASSMMNPQIKFGADVISRANYVLEHGAEGQKALSGAVRGALDVLIGKLTEEAGLAREEVELISVVGNTCMHHLLVELLPDTLVVNPYMPRERDARVMDPAQLGLHVHPQARLLLFPNIAGFVGGDTVGCLLATDFDHIDALTLMIDIGTNGELVLGSRTRRIACSTAAGPAFEGAKIACGMRGATGAIDHLHFEGDELIYSVIGAVPPTGICGSGLMDLVAALLQKGYIEQSGRLLSAEEAQSSGAQANLHRFVRIDNQPCFVVAFENETGTGKPVYLSQKDIREVQLAKAAIAAGIQLMSEELGKQVGDIQQVYIAGAFGNYMSPQSACAIGLIPAELIDRIVPIGNAAGEGAKLAAISAAEFDHAGMLARTTEFLELASKPQFQDCFVDELEFGSED